MEDPKSGCRFLVDNSCIPSWEHDEKCLQKNNFAKTRETFITCKTCPKESAPSLNMKNLELTVRGAKCLVKGHSPHSSSNSCNSQVLKFDFSETEQELGSSGQNTSGPEICPSNSSYYSGLSETDTPLALSRNRRFHSRSNSGISSLLPSDSCKYLTWQKVEQHDIRGSQLRCPRVREGPSEEELLFQQARHNLPPKKRVLEKNKWETWLQENWEDCEVLNISFQDLGDPYQVENFNRILRRLIRVETLWLVDNSLVDLSAIRLPSCRTLNLNRNYLTSFKQLPKLPRIQHLSLAENHIETLAGLPSLQSTPLESLILKRNPCEFHQNYRKCVFSCLPNLKMLDGISKLPEDFSPPEPNIFSKLCIVS